MRTPPFCPCAAPQDCLTGTGTHVIGRYTNILDLVDRTWPTLLERVCSESLATVWFEPIADLARGVAAGFRAQPRYPLSEADHGTWLRAADEHGYTGRLAAATLRASLACHRDLPANTYLVVELSGGALLSPEVAAQFSRAGDLSATVIELSGLPVGGDHVEVQRALEPIRRRGALLAASATGAGRIGLRELVELAPEFIGVDSELVAYVDQRPRHAATIAAVGSLASEIDAWIVADGVRRIEELDRLRELGVPLARGPLVGGEREVMLGLEPERRALLRAGAEVRDDHLSPLAEPVRAVPVRPQLASEITVVTDAASRPLEVIVPGPGNRTNAHPAMCVQAQDAFSDVALRAVSRPAADQLAPVCLVDETGALRGLIRIESLLRGLARATGAPTGAPVETD